MDTSPVSAGKFVVQHSKVHAVALAFAYLIVFGIVASAFELDGVGPWSVTLVIGAAVVALAGVLQFGWGSPRHMLMNRLEALQSERRMRRRINTASAQEKRVLLFFFLHRERVFSFQEDQSIRSLLYDGILKDMTEPNNRGFVDYKVHEQVFLYLLKHHECVFADLPRPT